MADLIVLDRLFRSGGESARLDAVEQALAAGPDWTPAKKWGGLFLRWARSPEMSPATCDILGPKLLGPLWLAGAVDPRQMSALALWPTVWPWRVGLTALGPSLRRGGDDWPLFEQFAKAVIGEDARFARERQAWNGLRRALTAARHGCPERAQDFLERFELEPA